MSKPKVRDLINEFDGNTGNLIIELNALEQRTLLDSLIQSAEGIPFQVNVLACELIKHDALDAKAEALLAQFKKNIKGNERLALIYRLLCVKHKLTDLDPDDVTVTEIESAPAPAAAGGK